MTQNPIQSARILAALRRLASLIRAELLYLDARYVRNHFCFHCDRQTFRQHRRCCFHAIVSEEWRQ